jgi:hypothetical protein
MGGKTLLRNNLFKKGLIIEIIKHGEIPSKRKYTASCNSCNTQFRFLRDEGNLQCSHRDGNYIAIDCPVCSNQVYTNADNYDKPQLLEEQSHYGQR